MEFSVICWVLFKLDGNVHRLLSRVLAIHAPPKSKLTLDVLWAGATAMVQGASTPGDVNQALIELGSTVCKVANPTCGSCPLRARCRAYGLQHPQQEQQRRCQPHENEQAQRGQTKAESRPPSDGTIDPHSSASKMVSSQDVRSSMAPVEGEDHQLQLPDLEDLCTLCVPLSLDASNTQTATAPPPVTAFPMRATKKKAREELDIVNVIEWRAHPTAQRYFLLVRRPEAGT